jgi:superfamily I DNA/RNA helicase
VRQIRRFEPCRTRPLAFQVVDERFSRDLLNGLTFEQREAVMSPAKRLLVRATAGSGKTHVLTLRIQRRILDNDVDADQVIAMTFTRKAGDELRKRLFRTGIRDITAGTFHRAANMIVTDFREAHNLKPFTIESARNKILNGVIDQLVTEGANIEDWQKPKIEVEVSWALSQGFDGPAYAKAARAHRRVPPIPAATFTDVLDRYVATCKSRGVLDFDLLLSEAINILRNEHTSLAAFRHKYRAIFVDEAQDMNPLQFTLLKVMAGDDPDLFTVGDPNQSIYGFNGANPKLLDELLATWPDTVSLDLTRNHRSTANIVTVASTLLEPGAAAIEPAKEGGDIPLVRMYDTDSDEAEAVAKWLSAMHQNASPWKSMAVLARTWSQLDVVAEALTAHGIPFERRGADHSPSADLVQDRFIADDHGDVVALSTIHRAKGLEFRHVAAIGWAEGQLPYFQASSPGDIAEEQRLAYVALSRAEDSLVITWSRALDDKRFHGREKSRFLVAIEAALAQMHERNKPLVGDRRRDYLKKLRETLEAGDATV